MAYQKKTFPKTGVGFEKGHTKKRTKFLEKYRGLSYEGRRDKAALEASDNGRCWWIQQFLMTPVYTYEQRQFLDNGKTSVRMHI